MITLEANKALAVLSNLISYVGLNDVISGDGTNKLIAFCQGENVTAGKGKAFISADIPEVEDYAKDTSLLELKEPVVDEEVLWANNYKFIRLSINRWLTPGAFTDSSAFANFAGYLIRTMELAKRKYIYGQIIATLEDYAPTLASQKVAISLTDISALTDATQVNAFERLNANKIAKSLINTIKLFNAPEKTFNDLGYTEMVDPKKMGFLVNSNFDTLMLVDTFASLFNSDLIKDRFMWGETIDIPYNQLASANQESVIGWLIHKGKITFGYGYEISADFFNPANLYDQRFLHFNYYLGVVKGLPAVKFTATYKAPTTSK